jgi:Domain of unknown function (DUF4340)
MEKRTLYALLAVVALGAIAFAVMRSPEKGQRKGPPPRPIAEIKAANVAKLELTNEKQEKTTLEKTGASEWRVKSPGDWKADQQGVKQVLDGLEKLTFADVASENADKQAELGVADGKGARVVAKDGAGKTLADLHVGKSVGGYTMVRVDGKNETWQASGLYPYVVGRAPNGWRDHAIFAFQAADADKLTVEAAESKLVLQKEGADKWKIAESSGTAPKTAAELDAQQPGAVVSSLANLHATDFADDKKVDDVKKDARVTLTVAGKGATHTLYIGGEKGDDVLAASADSPTVYTVKKYSIEQLARKPIDYRDKTIVKAKEADLTSVEITAGGGTTTLLHDKDGKWTAAKGTADEAKVKPAITAFDNFVASGFAEDKAPATTGLAMPQGQAVLKLKDKSTVTIKVGAATKDGSDYYVQKVGSPDVYLVKKYAVDRWMKKPADLTKK